MPGGTWRKDPAVPGADHTVSCPTAMDLCQAAKNANTVFWDNYFSFQRDKVTCLGVFSVSSAVSSNCPKMLYLERALIHNYIPLAMRIT